ETSWLCESAGVHTFPDVTGNAADIACLAATGITAGYPDGTFRPGTTLSREQMASFLVRLADVVADRAGSGAVDPIPPAQAGTPFGDVHPDNPHAEAIGRLAGAGITSGSTPDTFDPKAPVTR